MMTERNDAIIAAVAQGASQAAEATRWSISRERVRQICKRVGLTARLLRNAKNDAARTTIATAPDCYGITAIAMALHIETRKAVALGARTRLPQQGVLNARLAAERREVICLLRKQGMTTTEIMSELHLSVSTVCRHLKRLRLNDRPGTYKR